MKGKQILVFVMAMILCSVLLISCGTSSNTPSSTTQPAPAASQSATVSQPAPAAAPKTLKVGVVLNLQDTMGLDMSRATHLMVDMDNAAGGLKIGNDTYKIQLVEYDSQNLQATEVSAINRLVSEDQVKFIIYRGTFMSAWISTTETAKVITFGRAADYRVNLMPSIHYSFNTSPSNVQRTALDAWFCKKQPELVKNMVIAYPDSQMGHEYEKTSDAMWNLFGAKVTPIFYPTGTTDLSSLGTKVASLKPSAFSAVAGGASDMLSIKAVWQAGYRGQFFADSTATYEVLKTIVSADAAEGMINGAWPVEFDPASTDFAIKFKAAWVAKYGKWESPEVLYTGYYSCLRAALPAAGSLDVDAVAATISKGLKYEGPCGAMVMISRPDLGNDRTVDSAITCYLKQIESGKVTLIDTLSAEQAISYFQMAYPPTSSASK
jgi:branched-chain amino acid transport system substrate-binding protein